MSQTDQLTDLKLKLRELTYLKSALSVLQWDQEVFMPKKGVALRAETMAHIAGLIHDRFIHIDDDTSLSILKQKMDEGKLDKENSVLVREVWREFEREKKLPAKFVQ